MTIKWSIVPEVWSATNIIFCHFGSFFCTFNPTVTTYLKNQTFKKMEETPGDIIIVHMCTINENHMCMVPDIWSPTDIFFLPFWTIFCVFIPLTTQKIKILKKGKKAWRYHNFTHVYVKWQNGLSFWTLFCPFTPLTIWKIKILKKWNEKKTPGEITVLHMCTINENHMMYGSWDMECNGQNFLSF